MGNILEESNSDLQTQKQCRKRPGELYLDNYNPRIPVSKDQESTLINLLREDSKIYSLARSLAEYGLDPAEPLIIVEDAAHHFIVKEGNRRIAAIKILLNPDLIIHDDIIKNKYVKLSKKFDLSRLQFIDCILTDEETARRIFERRHQGEQGGKGLVGWTQLMQYRNERNSGKRVPVLDVLDEIIAEGSPSPNLQLSYLLGSFHISNLERLVRDQPKSRERLGLEFRDGSYYYVGDKEKIIEALIKIAENIADPDKKQRLKVREIYNENTEAPRYLNKILGDGVSLSDSSKISEKVKTGEKDEEITPIKQENEAKTNGDRGQIPSKQNHESGNRRTLIRPETEILKFHGETKSEAVFYELKRIQLNDTTKRPGYKYSISVALRTFIEMTVDAYAERNHIEVKYQTNYGTERNRKLMEIVQDVCDDLIEKSKKNPCLNIDIDSVKILKNLNINNNPHNFILISELNDYVHDRKYHPSIDGLLSLWDNIEKAIVIIWNNMEKNN